MLSAIHAYIRQRYVLNTTALALMRIALSMVLLMDLYFRFTNRAAFYSAAGFWPAAFAKIHAPLGSWSIYTLFPSDSFFVMGCAIHALALIALLLGWRTAYVTPLVWFMCYQLQQRNPYVNQGGDSLVLIVLLCACFLPWGERLSLDARHQRTGLNYTAAHLFLIFSLILLYAFTVLHKQAPEWRWDGTAIHKTLELHQLRSEAGNWLLQQHSLSQMLTWLVLASEALIALFLLLPWFSASARLAAFILMVLIHLGFALFLRVGIFPFVNLAVALALLPFEEQLERTNRDSLPSTALVCFALLVSLNINLSTLPQWPFQLHASMQFVANASGLNQNWGMFSPGIMRDDGWFSSKLQYQDGSNHVIENELTRSHADTPLLDDRWRKFNENLQKPGCSFLTTAYCYYLLRKHNHSSPKTPAVLHFLYFHPLHYTTEGRYELGPIVLASACHE